jgi:hypothetical protein
LLPSPNISELPMSGFGAFSAAILGVLPICPFSGTSLPVSSRHFLLFLFCSSIRFCGIAALVRIKALSLTLTHARSRSIARANDLRRMRERGLIPIRDRSDRLRSFDIASSPVIGNDPILHDVPDQKTCLAFVWEYRQIRFVHASTGAREN